MKPERKQVEGKSQVMVCQGVVSAREGSLQICSYSLRESVKACHFTSGFLPFLIKLPEL